MIHCGGWTLVVNPDGITTAWHKDKTKVSVLPQTPGQTAAEVGAALGGNQFTLWPR